MRRFRSSWRRLMIAAVLLLALNLLTTAVPARANVDALRLHRRSCGSVTTSAIYDSFSEGTPPFFAVFVADLDNDGVFGRANEPTQYVLLSEEPGARTVGTRLNFPALPEGSIISVTAYEVDAAGKRISKQLEPVTYRCAHKPALEPIDANTDIDEPGVGIVAKVNVEALLVYNGPSVQSGVLGGLARGTPVDVLGRNGRGDWLQIVFGGKTGWVMWQKQMILFGPYTQLAVLAN